MSVNTKCQVFTPTKYVEKLLDVVGYRENLYGMKVADNSCGDGNVLVEIVKRYIVDSLKNKISLRKIKKGLENDIWAAEIDEAHIVNCKIKLNQIAADFGIYNVKWNIVENDFLKLDINEKFDFVIGNPPYITYKELDVENREFIRSTYETCKIGKFDYCYAFIEASIKSLKKNGKLAYLIPSNIFKTQFGLNLRNYMLTYLTDIYDYTNKKIFEGKLTSSSIIVCNICNANKNIFYHNVITKEMYSIDKSFLTDKWVFRENQTVDNSLIKVRFGDFFHTASSIATLLNKVFIISDFEDEEKYVRVGEYKIEKALLKRAASPRSLNYKKNEYVIFPYYYKDGELRKYSEEEFLTDFPCASIYLKSYEIELKNRNSDNGISWFEYGRSQALQHLNQEKLLLSTLITGTVKITLLDKNTIPTSGLYIVPKNNSEYSLETAMNILRSELFLEYVKSIGVISNGNSYRISPKDINNFMFPEKYLYMK